MNSATLMGIPHLDDSELLSRRRFFELEDIDLERLKGMHEFAARHSTEMVGRFYERMLGHPETRTFFPDRATVDRLKQKQTAYFQELFAGVCDRDYVEKRLRIGAVHERVGMPTKWYIGAYCYWLRLALQSLADEHGLDREVLEGYESLLKLVCFDMALSIDTYMEAHLARAALHQQAIQELSTPVIKVHDQVLLLPIIGTVDSLRAHQIMETVLLRVTSEKARVIILDIAGVGVVDTEVASHLMRTTAAVRLLGAQTVLTGISAQVARTIVELGVEITTMATRSTLAQGIELALGIVGKCIVDKERTP